MGEDEMKTLKGFVVDERTGERIPYKRPEGASLVGSSAVNEVDELPHIGMGGSIDLRTPLRVYLNELSSMVLEHVRSDGSVRYTATLVLRASPERAVLRSRAFHTPEEAHAWIEEEKRVIHA